MEIREELNQAKCWFVMWFRQWTTIDTWSDQMTILNQINYSNLLSIRYCLQFSKIFVCVFLFCLVASINKKDSSVFSPTVIFAIEIKMIVEIETINDWHGEWFLFFAVAVFKSSGPIFLSRDSSIVWIIF